MEKKDFISPTQINPKSLEDKRLKDKPILVMVGAGFCGGCKMAAPVFDEFAHKYPQIVCAVIPLDGTPEQRELGRTVGMHCQRQSIPFFVVYDRKGRYVKNEQVSPSLNAFGQLVAGL